MACTLHNGPCFEASEQQIGQQLRRQISQNQQNQPTNEQFQLSVPEVCYFPDGSDSESDDNSDAEYGLGL